MKNLVFFRTSVLRGFWEGFGRGLGDQNPRFSQFFRCFFEVIFEACFGRRKNQPKMWKNQTFPLFGGGFAVYGTLLGREYREGNKKISESLATRCSMLVSCVWCWGWWWWSSTPLAHLRWPADWNPPGGTTAFPAAVWMSKGAHLQCCPYLMFLKITSQSVTVSLKQFR